MTLYTIHSVICLVAGAHPPQLQDNECTLYPGVSYTTHNIGMLAVREAQSGGGISLVRSHHLKQQPTVKNDILFIMSGTKTSSRGCQAIPFIGEDFMSWDCNGFGV